MLLGDVVDQLLDEHGLADASTTEQADLAALAVRSQQVDHLDAGLKHLGLGLELGELGSLAVDGSRGGGGHRTLLVNGLAEDVEDAAKGGFTYGHRDRSTGVHSFHAAHQAVGAAHGNGADTMVAQKLLHFSSQANGLTSGILGFNPKGVVDPGQLAGRKFNVQHGADDLTDNPLGAGIGGSSSSHKLRKSQ